MPCPTPMHMVARPERAPPLAHGQRGGQRQPRAGHAERMAERDRAAVRVHVLGIVRQAELRAAPPAPARRTPRSARSRRSRRASGPVCASSFCTAGAGPMPMMRGGTPAVAIATTRARGVRPWRRAASSRGDEQRRGAVVDARGVAGRDRAAGSRNGVRSLASAFQRGVAARMLVLVDDGVALAAR